MELNDLQENYLSILKQLLYFQAIKTKKVKRIFLSIAIGVLCFQFVHAQFSLGVSGGLNLANIKYDVKIGGFEGFDTKNALYYFFGIIPKYNINSKLSVSTDIQYSIKGYRLMIMEFLAFKNINMFIWMFYQKWNIMFSNFLRLA